MQNHGTNAPPRIGSTALGVMRLSRVGCAALGGLRLSRARWFALGGLGHVTLVSLMRATLVMPRWAKELRYESTWS